MQETHAQRAYDHLRAKFVSGEFVPGSRLRYGPIGRELGISATPVREAIGQLANEGFVELVPQLGAVVRRISREQVIELYELREALEPYAAARAAERIRPKQLQEIRLHLEQMRAITDEVRQAKTKPPVARAVVQGFEQEDLTFHMLIIEATGNHTMMRTVGNSHLLARIFSMERHGYDVDVMAATCEDHRRILSALEQGKPDAARDAMAVHIRNGLELTLATESGETDRWWKPS